MQDSLKTRTMEDYDLSTPYAAASRRSSTRYIRGVAEHEEGEDERSSRLHLPMIVGGAIASWLVPIALATHFF